jgi:hypothetical protein
MNEDALRSMVREAIARHLGSGDTNADDVHRLALTVHPSHFRYTLPPSDGPCLIEPGVRCNHCGYCESHGH